MKEAVTFGRYNNFSYGHISTLIAILKDFKKINIGLIADDKKSDIYIEEKFKRLYELADENYTKKKLLPVDIRKKMIIAGIKQFDSRLLEKINIKIIKRPEYFIHEFNNVFPLESYELVFPKAKEEKNEFDLLRNDLMSELLERKISFVTPKLTVHNSQMSYRDREKYIPSEVLKILDNYNESIIEK